MMKLWINREKAVYLLLIGFFVKNVLYKFYITPRLFFHKYARMQNSGSSLNDPLLQVLSFIQQAFLFFREGIPECGAHRLR